MMFLEVFCFVDFLLLKKKSFEHETFSRRAIFEPFCTNIMSLL